MRLFKNRFFIAALSAALIIATCATVLSIMGIESPLRSIFGTIAVPFRWCGAKIADGIAGFSEYFAGFRRLAEENQALKKENAELREQLAAAQADAAENESLREYLGLESLSPEWSLVDALVIGRESGSYMTVYTLNRGTLHGVGPGMAVITAEGVVGYVKEAGLSWCKVVPITETTAAVGAYIERTGASGLVTGDYSLRAEGLCRMSYVENGGEIAEGDLVITSGKGNIYPPGITVGTVEKVVPDPYSRTFEVTVRPSADLKNISRVMIITSYKVTAQTEADASGGQS
jgi:rod shape-determining protein MreC